MPAAIFMVGETYGRLTVLAKVGTACTCRCSCGATAVVRMDKLRSGKTKSCGCLRSERWNARSKVARRLGLLWSNMKQRCHNPAHPAFARYGGRGIYVCERWRESSDAFIADMAPSYSPGLTLERIDNDKGYSPDNCVWADWFQQASNRGNTVRFADGTSVVGWARKNGLDVGRVQYIAAETTKAAALTPEAVLSRLDTKKHARQPSKGALLFPNGASFAGVARLHRVPLAALTDAYHQLWFESGEPPTQTAVLEALG